MYILHILFVYVLRDGHKSLHRGLITQDCLLLGRGIWASERCRSLVRPLVSSLLFGPWLRCFAKGPRNGDSNKETSTPARWCPVLGPGSGVVCARDGGRRLRARCRCGPVRGGGIKPAPSPHSCPQPTHRGG